MPLGRLKRQKALVGFGFLVRQRRLAQAIERLGTKHAYEGRMLLRTMIEIQINYSWIVEGSGHSRALRFLRFDPSERREILKEVAVVLPGARAQEALARFTRQRTDTRHLFRLVHPKTGKRSWAKTWASKPSLPARLIEVLKLEATKSGKPQSDTFMYGLYRWTSSAVHGGPVSLSEVVSQGHSSLVPKRQPEHDPTAQLLAAGMFLLAAADRLTAEARWRRPYTKELKELLAAMHALKTAKGRGA